MSAVKVSIQKITKSSTQSGRANSKKWSVKINNPGKRYLDPLMGWTSSADTTQQISMQFNDLDSAIRYVKSNYKNYEITMPNEKIITPKSYADNFLD